MSNLKEFKAAPPIRTIEASEMLQRYLFHRTAGLPSKAGELERRIISLMVKGMHWEAKETG